MNKLYPLKFEPILSDKIWGGPRLKKILHKENAGDHCGESWEISTVEGNISIVSNGFLKGNNLKELIEIYMDELVGDRIYDTFGLMFPLLIKFIDANDVLSIQVHPDDDLASERHNSFGKTEMWYIIGAEEGAELISGFKSVASREIYLEKLKSGSLQDILNYEKVKEGDVFFIPAGRVHAIGSGILLAEIQQTSDITYRIYDFDRRDKSGNTRELHTDLALDAIDFSVQDSVRTNYEKALNKTVQLESCPYFTTNLIHFTDAVDKDYSFIDSFVIYICTRGKVDLDYGEDVMSLEMGETVLIPAEIKEITLTPREESILLEVYVR